MKTLPRPLIFTGSRGRLASVLAERFARAGAEVVLVSRTGGGNHLSYEDLWNSTLLQSGGALLHCAWSTVPATAEAHPASAWRQDLPLLARLLSELQNAGPERAPHLFFFSSGGAVYGECPQPAREDGPLQPISWYGRGKVAAETLLGHFRDSFGLRAATLRISNPYGFPYVPEKPQGITGAALRALKTGLPLPLLGGGTSRKDFLHLEDLFSALQSILSCCLEGTWNVGAGVSHSIQEVLATLSALTGRTIPTRTVPAAAWDVHESQLDCSALQEATGWQPKFSLEEGLREVLRATG